MKTKEIIERGIDGDPRVYNAIQKARLTDNSFKEKENVFTLLTGGIKYTQAECREFWFKAMALGMQEGLRMGSLQGQRIDITNSCKNERHNEFYAKFLKLSEEYNCAILYHPLEGMCVVDLNNH